MNPTKKAKTHTFKTRRKPKVGSALSAALSLIMVFTLMPWVFPCRFQSFAGAPPASEICGDIGSWGEWSTVKPGANAYYESKTQYRYRDKETTTSYSTSLDGYIQDGGSWITYDSGEILYADSWPSGFNKESWYYVNYGSNIPKTNSETTTRKTVVSTTIEYYIYWHWCRGSSNGATDRFVQDHRVDDYTHWHSFSSKDIGREDPLAFNTTGKGFYYKDNTVCKDSYWWYATYINDPTQLALKKCTYTTYHKLFNYYRWMEWSDWSDTKYTSSGNRQVETRTLYRIYNYTPHAWDNGTVTQPAKYLSTGTKVYTCSNCGAMKSETIPKLDASKITPAKVKLTSAKVSGKKLTLTWKRVSKKTKGYQIAVKNKKTKKVKHYTVKAGSKSKISKKIKLKKGTYAVKVRAYNIVEGHKFYGAWSKVKGGRIK